jgi:hypothetical protein
MEYIKGRNGGKDTKQNEEESMRNSVVCQRGSKGGGAGEAQETKEKVTHLLNYSGGDEELRPFVFLPALAMLRRPGAVGEILVCSGPY